MAIDHGLQGKSRSREEREKRAKQKQRKARKMMALAREQAASNSAAETIQVKGKRGEVLFDEAARVAWMTGFRKRKTERRKIGLAMQIIKDKSKRKGARTERVDAMKSISLASNDDEEEYDGDKSYNQDKCLKDTDKETVFMDDQTMNMFGSSVSVIVGTDIANDLCDNFVDNEEESGADNTSVTSFHSKGGSSIPQISRFEKAMRDVNKKGLLEKRSRSSKEKRIQKNKTRREEGGVGQAKGLMQKIMARGAGKKQKGRGKNFKGKK